MNIRGMSVKRYYRIMIGYTNTDLFSFMRNEYIQ